MWPIAKAPIGRYNPASQATGMRRRLAPLEARARELWAALAPFLLENYCHGSD